MISANKQFKTRGPWTLALCLTTAARITQILHRCYLKSSLRQSASNDPKMTLKLQGQRYPIYVLQVSPSPKRQSILLYGHLFSYRPFWDKCTKWLKMTLNTIRMIRSNVHHICCIRTYKSQISVPFSPRLVISKISASFQLTTMLNVRVFFLFFFKFQTSKKSHLCGQSQRTAIKVWLWKEQQL